MKAGIRSSLFCILISCSLQAQTTYNIGDLSLDKNNEEWFDQQIGQAKNVLAIGKFVNLNLGARFDGTKFWVPGQISYQNNIYHNVGMIYNAEDDQLIIQHPDAIEYPSEQFLPFQDQIQWFEVGDHKFRYFPEAILNSPAGFFEEVCRIENMAFLIKRTKKLVLTESGESFYEVSDNFIIQNGGKYYRYFGKNSMLKAFKMNKKEIKQFVRDQNLNFYRKDVLKSEFEMLFDFISSLNTK